MNRLALLAFVASLAVLSAFDAARAVSPGPTSRMGTVVAWGSDAFGQTDVPADLTNAVAICAGIEHSLALRADHTVVAWGAGEYGQTNTPAGLSDVVAISTRGYHNLALKSDGTVVAWGLDNDLQAEVPANLTQVKAIAAGGNHSLALKTDGTVMAWGWDAYQQIDVPAGLSGVVAIAAGSRHSLALKSDGTVVVWGNPGYDIAVPAGLRDVVAISAGRFYNLALKAEGTVVAWGDNTDGQTNVPPDWTDIVEIAAGGFHNLALRANGQVVGFGLNDSGQANIPADVTHVTALAAGTSHSLAIVSTTSPDPSGELVTVGIADPVAETVWRSQSLTARGTAHSANGISAVFYQLNHGAWASASTTDDFAHWSADLSLATGANLLQAYAIDNAGSVSATNSVPFTCEVTDANSLRVQITGSGRVSPNWTQETRLRIGKAYRLTALPAPGWTFYQWTGDTNSFEPTLHFVMQSNLTLVASFVSNPYAGLKGTFTGLFYGYTNDTELDVGNSGALTLTFTRNGAYSGRVSMLSGIVSISGHAHLDATDTNIAVVSIAAKRSQRPAVAGSFQIDLRNPDQGMTGALEPAEGTGNVAVALFEGLRVRTGKTNPDRGVYHFNLEPQGPDAGPMGGSFGRASVKSGSPTTVTLNLADQNGTVAVNAAETQDGLIPFFARLYGNQGLVSGWLQITNHSILSSNVVWFKKANASKTLYPQGFLQLLEGAGSLFTPATRGNLIQASTGTISLDDGAGISSAASFTVTAGAFKMPAGQNTNAIAFTLGPGNGQLSGSFRPPGFKQRFALKGLLIPTNANAAPFVTGYFVEPSRTGRLLISFQ